MVFFCFRRLSDAALRSSLRRCEYLSAFPPHKRRDAQINDDGDDAHDKIDVAGAFQDLDRLRPDFRPYDGSHSHNQSETQVDVSEGAMASRGYYRFSDNVR